MLVNSGGPMSGEKSEVRIRELAPHLLDSDTDLCPHMHNIVKNFTSYFGKFLERLFATSTQTLNTLLTHLKV